MRRRLSELKNIAPAIIMYVVYVVIIYAIIKH